MHEEHAMFPISLSARIKRRTLLKAGAGLGLSAAALEAWLAGAGTALAETPGLVGYWPLNEGSGSTVLDASGNGNAGQVSGATWATGRLGRGLSFNGSSSTVNLGKPVVVTSRSFTVAAWVLLTDLSSWHTAVSQDGSNVSGFYLQLTSSGQFAFSGRSPAVPFPIAPLQPDAFPAVFQFFFFQPVLAFPWLQRQQWLKCTPEWRLHPICQLLLLQVNALSQQAICDLAQSRDKQSYQKTA